MLTWQEPQLELRNGIIVDYIGFVVELPGQDRVANFTTNDTEVVIDELNPHTNYAFRIAAQNSIGIGPHSPISLIKTAEDGKRLWWEFISDSPFFSCSSQ